MAIADLRVWSISIEHRRELREAIEARRRTIGEGTETIRSAELDDRYLTILKTSLSAVDDLLEALKDEKDAHEETKHQHADVLKAVSDDLLDIIHDGTSKPRSKIVAMAQHALTIVQRR